MTDGGAAGAGLMGFDELWSAALELLEVEPPDDFGPHVVLGDDLGLDSLQLFYLLLLLEAMANVAEPPVEVPDLVTTQDAYDYYRSIFVPT